jgi:ABC-type multidrug transport system ATPase subunit
MLTGLFEITSGSARIAGFDMKSETKFAYQNMGICPQSNLLWESLTVQEHLLFYARIKGFISQEEKAVVRSSLETVELVGFESRLISSLSHGEKRRLAIAIAIVGDPKVIFLDEPTVNLFSLSCIEAPFSLAFRIVKQKDLDPVMKRQIWNIILKCKKDRSIIMVC